MRPVCRTTLLCFLFALASCESTSASAGATTTVCATDTYGESDDSGGADDGCMFVPYCNEGEDDGPTDKLDLGNFPDLGCDPNCPPPPEFSAPVAPYAVWEHHSATDTYYRYASEMEIEVHGWAPGTVLMSAETSVAGLTNGSSSLTLGIPLGSPTGAITIEAIALSKAQTRNDAWYVTAEDAATGPLSQVFRPDFHLFLPTWVDFEVLRRPPGTDVFIWAYGDSHGGVAIRGLMASQEFSILGPTTELWLETLPPDHAGVLVSTPVFGTTDFDNILNHWIDVIVTACDGEDCNFDTNLPVEPGNCGDCLDNDQDVHTDTNDLFCKHRSDFGCNGVGDHNHRWENSKNFAVMPDIEWCTTMKLDGMPWHAEVNMKASSASAMINAIPMALEWMHDRGLEQDVEVPNNVATIRHRMAYCVFAPDVEAAGDCIDDDAACPSMYQLGGVTHVLAAEEGSASNAYFHKLWVEFDQAAATLEDEGVTPKPVAMLTSIYSGDLVDGIAWVVGYAGSAGGLDWQNPPELGPTILEAEHFVFPNVAHELGHALGLSHTVDNGAPVNRGGFMQATSPFPPYSLLGPSLNPNAGYGVTNQWLNWAIRIGDKTVPRPNGFAWTGCASDNDCPSQLECRFFSASAPGVCRWPL